MNIFNKADYYAYIRRYAVWYLDANLVKFSFLLYYFRSKIISNNVLLCLLNLF